jgi:starch phosphorylase
MFPKYPINSITNGVHTSTWTSAPFAQLYDRHIPQWRHDSLYLRYTISIPVEEIQDAHLRAKQDLVAEVSRRTGIHLDKAAMTIGFARRATGYKRANLIFSDRNRLRQIISNAGPIQLIYGGKAHPHDESGKEIIRSIFKAGEELKDILHVVYLEDYDMDLMKYMVSG